MQELQFSNKRLQAELASAREAQQAGTERSRRALRSLREGLAAVESAVAARSEEGSQLIRMAFECLAQMKQQLMDDPRCELQPEVELQVTLTLAEAVKILSQLQQSLLAGSGERSHRDAMCLEERPQPFSAVADHEKVI